MPACGVDRPGLPGPVRGGGGGGPLAVPRRGPGGPGGSGVSPESRPVSRYDGLCQVEYAGASNAVFAERHLPSLARFARFLEDQREELPAPEWHARYALAYQWLTTEVLPAFSPETLELASRRASC